MKSQTIECPECGSQSFADFVDVGTHQVQPYHCPNCNWTQPCPYANDNDCDKCISNSYCTNQPTKLQRLKDTAARNLNGMTKAEADAKKVCVSCGEPITGFKDQLSIREYTISGLCQKCQDEVFV